MPSDQATNADHPLTQSDTEKYLVLAADMSTYDGDSISAYQWVVTNAQSMEDALEIASTALESRGGCQPLAAYTAAELRELADTLSAHALEPRRAYNLSMGMTDTEVAASDQE